MMKQKSLKYAVHMLWIYTSRDHVYGCKILISQYLAYSMCLHLKGYWTFDAAELFP